MLEHVKLRSDSIETKPWRFEAREFVRQTWAAMIARPSLERHAIFNLVGAQILCDLGSSFRAGHAFR